MNYYMYELNCDVKIWKKQRKDRYLTNINDIYGLTVKYIHKHREE